MHKTSLGSDENTTSTLCYTFGWISGLIFMILEKENKAVRFHAWQAFLLFFPLQVIMVLFVLIPFLGWFFLLPPLSLGYILLWIGMIVSAYQGKKIVLPFLGPLAEKYSSGSKESPINS